MINISTEKTEGSIFSSSKEIVIITKNREISWDLPDYEQDLFKSLVHSEKNKIEKSSNLYSKLGLSRLESYGKNQWWFTKENVSKGGIFVIFILLMVIGSRILPESIVEKIWPILWILMLFWIWILWWGTKLKESEEWAKLISHILWYREFLSMCDENKLKLFLQQDPLYFDKILPYAVAFGLETEFIKKIEPIMQEMNIKSSWYDWNIHSMYMINDIISSAASHSIPSYDSDSWFSGWSSFGWWFSSWWWGGWGWWRSW